VTIILIVVSLFLARVLYDEVTDESMRSMAPRFPTVQLVIAGVFFAIGVGGVGLAIYQVATGTRF
jgi:hypothetical protein